KSFNNDDAMFDNIILLISGLKNGTSKGNSMHVKNFKYIILQLDQIEEHLSDLSKKIKFSEKCFTIIDKALHIKIITLLDATIHNKSSSSRIQPC
ncbi:1568_t:CDS:1, partial [Funneliformis caledonium]